MIAIVLNGEVGICTFEDETYYAIKNGHSDPSTAVKAWNRSACYSNARFNSVEEDGSSSNHTSYYSYGFAPAFCITA